MNTQAIREFCDAWDAGKEIEVQPAWHEKMTPFRVSKSTHPSYEPNFAHDMHTVVEPLKLTVDVGRWYEDKLTDAPNVLVLAIHAGWVHFLTMSEPDERYKIGCVHEARLTREVPCPDWAKAWYRKPGKVETEYELLHGRRYIRATPEVLAALGETEQ